MVQQLKRDGRILNSCGGKIRAEQMRPRGKSGSSILTLAAKKSAGGTGGAPNGQQGRAPSMAAPGRLSKGHQRLQGQWPRQASPAHLGRGEEPCPLTCHPPRFGPHLVRKAPCWSGEAWPRGAGLTGRTSAARLPPGLACLANLGRLPGVFFFFAPNLSRPGELQAPTVAVAAATDDDDDATTSSPSMAAAHPAAAAALWEAAV